MTTECERFTGRLREICEGTADLPIQKINAYRRRWNLYPLPGEDHPTAPRKQRPARIARSRPPSNRKPPTPRPKRKSAGGCAGCGKRKSRTLKPNGYGPGSQLLKLWSDMPHCDACEHLAAQMDAWGKAGCTARLDEIVTDIIPRAEIWMAENKPWAHKILSVTSTEQIALRIGIAHKVRQAINLAPK